MILKRSIEESKDYDDSTNFGYDLHGNRSNEDIIKILVRQMNISEAALRCYFRTQKTNLTGVYCEPVLDEYDLCWHATQPNETSSLPCPNFNETDGYASRHCNKNGTWSDGGITNYERCIQQDDLSLAMIMRDIYFVTSIVSLVLLFIALFIFFYFKSLNCTRISIHKNLVISFIIRSVLIILVVEPYIFRRETTYRDVNWLCKVITVLVNYAVLANIFWMFVEGLFLHNRIVVAVFSTEAPFKLFFLLGWGVPALIAGVWAIVNHFVIDARCWDHYSQSPYYYIIMVPFIIALSVNLIFLINIIRILVTKLRANNSVESAQIRKAIKATIVLMPLLGLTNLLFVMGPEDKGGLQVAYHVTNAILQSSQGSFVAILYCFLNGEVRNCIKQKWYRFKIRHNLKPGGRRRSSRTSSFFLSQTEVQELSELARLTHNQKHIDNNISHQTQNDSIVKKTKFNMGNDAKTPNPCITGNGIKPEDKVRTANCNITPTQNNGLERNNVQIVDSTSVPETIPQNILEHLNDIKTTDV